MTGRGMIRRSFAALAPALLLLCSTGAAGAAEGPPVEVTITGNEAFDRERIRKSIAAELERIEDGKHLAMTVDDAAFQMESEYRSEGFPFVLVDYTIDKEGRKVAFEIEEGPRVILGAVTFDGNEFFPDSDLKAFFGGGGSSLSQEFLSVITLGASGEKTEEIPFARDRVEEAIASIGDLYYVKGFVESRISDAEITFSADKTRADVAVIIEEGPQHFIRRVTFSGDVALELEEKLAKLDASLEGEIFQASRRTALRSRTVEIYRIGGYPDVHVEIVEGRGEGPGDITLEAVIESGPRVRVTGFDIEGNRKTRESFIRKRILMEEGDWYNLQKERQSFLNLNRTGIFRSVEGALEGEEGSEARRLKISLRERPSRRVGFDVGWGSYEKLRGAVGFTERNFFGSGREVGVAVGGSMKGWYLRGLFTDPWFLGTKITASAPLSYSLREQPGYTEKKLEAAAVLTRKLSKYFTGSLRYSFKSSDTTKIQAEDPDPDLQEDYNMGSLRLRLTGDKRDDFFYPSKGAEGSLSLEVADPLLGGDVSFFRFTFATALFFSLFEDTVIALRWDTGVLYPTSENTSIPLPERFYNGGENSVRSYHEDRLGPKDLDGDPLGGIAANVWTVELRQRLAGNIAGALFVDIGNVVPNRSRVEQGLPPYQSVSELLEDTTGQYFSDLHYAVGAGLHYLLPVGPLRLDVAMNPDPQEGEEKWVAHFSLGMSF